jgi:hypothetical protein
MSGMGVRRSLCLCAALSLLLPPGVLQAEELGRLFLSSKQRAKLEMLRNAEPEPPPVVEQLPEPEDLATNPADRILPEIDLPEEPQLTESLMLKGIVKRKDGRSTAWVNDSNTYEAGPDLDQIELHDSDISESGVKVTLPDKVTNVTLKVGQTYEPDNDSGLKPAGN